MPAATQMSRGTSDYDAEIRERSGWLVPGTVFTIIAVLCAAFLFYYLLPNPSSFIEEHPSPTARADPVHISVAGVRLTIPANYLLYASARKGGARREVALYAELPDFRGYSDSQAQLFSRNGAAPAIIYVLIREAAFDVSEAKRLQRIYLNDVVDTRGKSGPFGLIEYSFRDDSGYRGEDLLVGRTGPELVVMRCARPGPEAPSPNCFREMALAEGTALSYRFKRSHIADWRRIARGVAELVASFATPGK